jgi:hypothetical protein
VAMLQQQRMHGNDGKSGTGGYNQTVRLDPPFPLFQQVPPILLIFIR